MRNQLNWFLSPGFLDYKISDFDLLRIATMICFLNKNKVQENLDEHVLNHKKISVNLIEIENYRNDSYLLPVYNLAIELKKSNIKYIEHFLIHGSLATLDFKKGWSDLDTWVVINDDVFNDPKNLIELHEKFKKLNKYLFQIDSIAHHGYIILLKSNLSVYTESLMPIKVLEKAYSLMDNNLIELSILNDAKSGLYRIQNMLDLFVKFGKTGVFEHHKYKNEYLTLESMKLRQGMYQLKYLISLVVSIPSIYYTILGKPVYKRDSFSPFYKEFKSSSQILFIFSEIRSMWEIEEDYPYIPNQIPQWVIDKLPEDFIAKITNLIKDVNERFK